MYSLLSFHTLNTSCMFIMDKQTSIAINDLALTYTHPVWRKIKQLIFDYSLLWNVIMMNS